MHSNAQTALMPHTQWVGESANEVSIPLFEGPLTEERNGNREGKVETEDGLAHAITQAVMRE